MKTLNEYLNESLLDDFDNKSNNMDISALKGAIKEVEKWINEHYKVTDLNVSKTINADGKFVVDCRDAHLKMEAATKLTSLTNEYFVWGKIGKDFYCIGCNKLESLEGAPIEVKGDFVCNKCENLKSLKGAPKKVGRDFYCANCYSLTTLEGAPKNSVRDFYCNECENLKSLKGAPEKIKGNFNCSLCFDLNSLEGAPKEVGGFFKCNECGGDFTKEDVMKISNVKKSIIY